MTNDEYQLENSKKRTQDSKSKIGHSVSIVS